MSEFTITMTEAEAYSGVPLRKWLAWSREGLIPSFPRPPDKLAPQEQATYAAQCRIPVSSLPRHATDRFYRERVIHAAHFSVDFIGFLNRYGPESFAHLLDTLHLCKAAAGLRNCHRLQSTPQLRRLAAQHHISLSTLYRKEALVMSSDLKKLLPPASTRPAASRKLCPLAQEYLACRYLMPNAPSQNQLLRDLSDQAYKLGKSICSRCPYNPTSAAHRRWHRAHPDTPLPNCTDAGQGMIIPSTRYPVNRFLASLSEQEVALGQRGSDYWTTHYAPKTVRTKPETVNAVWFGDHHLADVLVIAGHQKDGSPILARPWLTVVTDAASDAIVGSVVTLRPNSMTIAESFCRAAAFTVDSPFYGLPEVFYVDRGKDYRAMWLRGADPAQAANLRSDACLNQAFCDHPLLSALNVTVCHALPRTGRSKTIERIFGTLTRTWFQALPGWTGNNPQKRPFDFEQEKKRLLAQGKLLTLEQFARTWFEVIVPAYNNAAFEQAQSPLSRYQALPRANTLTPDWNSLAVFKVIRNRKYKVHPNGIHYKGDFYWHPALRDYISHRGKDDRYVQIYDFDQSFCHSISVLYKGHFVCEAEPLIRMRVTEADRLRLEQHLEEQKATRRAVSRRVAKVRQVLQTAGVSAKRYAEYISPDGADVVLPLYAEEIDDRRDRQEAVVLSETANHLGQLALQRQRALEALCFGPAANPLSDLLLQEGSSEQSKKD